jgi:hypothetical protein
MNWQAFIDILEMGIAAFVGAAVGCELYWRANAGRRKKQLRKDFNYICEELLKLPTEVLQVLRPPTSGSSLDSAPSDPS